MLAQDTTWQVDDQQSLGTRVRWGPILAGGTLALALYSLLTILGAAVGLSISDRVSSTTLTTAAVVWALFTTCAALFVGGLVTSLFTVGENKMEAVLHGIIMWGALFVSFVILGAAGVRGGFTAMAGMANSTHLNSSSWETGAREAGVPSAQIDEWRRAQGPSASKVASAPDAQTQAAQAEATTRVTWYAFAGMWLSMMAAAAGALMGAGPVFRIVVQRTVGPVGAVGAARTDGRLGLETGNGARGFATTAPVDR